MKKLSNREKILVTIFIIASLAYGYYQFVYKVQSNQIVALQEKLQVQESMVHKVMDAATITHKNTKKIKVNNFITEEISKKYFPIMNQENFLKVLKEIIETLNVDMQSIPLPEYTVESVTIDKYQDGLENGGSTLENLINNYENGKKLANTSENIITKDSTAEEKIQEEEETSEKERGVLEEDSGQIGNNENTKGNITLEDKYEDPSKVEVYAEKLTIKKISIPFNFEGSYSKFRDSVKYFNKFRRNIIISSLSISALDQDKYSVNMTLDFYFIPNVEGEQCEFFKWNMKGGAGMYNPFVSGGKSVSKDYFTMEQIQDFFISISPETSDKPTVIMGKCGDTSRSTYVYEDENAVTEIAIEFTEKHGKYYYKYNTKSEKYPKDEEWEETLGKSFIPKGENMILHIYSNKRVNLEDMSGINLTVKNLTNKRVHIYIMNDEESRPRLVNLYKEGIVEVKQS